MLKQLKKLTIFGKIIVSIFLCTTICLVIILQLFKSHISNQNRETDTPLLFKECLPKEKGIDFREEKMIVHKDVIFCTEIISKERIPSKTMIIYDNGKTILPLLETSVTATYAVRLRELSINQWHIVATQ